MGMKLKGGGVTHPRVYFSVILQKKLVVSAQSDKQGGFMVEELFTLTGRIRPKVMR